MAQGAAYSMSIQDATPYRGAPVVIPSHLVPWLRAAAHYELELACDAGGEWSPQVRDRVLTAAWSIGAIEAGVITSFMIEHLTTRAMERKDAPPWPPGLPEPEARRIERDLVGELRALRDEARWPHGRPRVD
jgi:hypothetical protein